MNNFLLLHRQLFIWILCLALVGFLANKWLNHEIGVDTAKSAISMNEYNKSKDTTSEADKEVQAVQSSTNRLIASLANQQAVLAKQQAQLTVALSQQQDRDRALMPNDLARRWEELIGRSGVESTASGFSVSGAAAVSTVTSLEEIPVQNKSIQNQSAIIKSNTEQISSLTTLSDSKSKEIDALKDQIKTGEKACYDKIDAVKALDRRSKRNWFFRGLAVGGGIVGYIALHI